MYNIIEDQKTWTKKLFDEKSKSKPKTKTKHKLSEKIFDSKVKNDLKKWEKKIIEWNPKQTQKKSNINFIAISDRNWVSIAYRSGPEIVNWLPAHPTDRDR